MKILYFFILFFCSCVSYKNLLKQAIKYEEKGFYDKAVVKYFEIIKNCKEEKYVVEAKYRLALIYKDVKKNYVEAKNYFNQIIEESKDSNFVELAKVAILESPDYIGAIDGNVVILGDVESQGKNMKVSYEFKKIDYNLYLCKTTIYAGNQIVKQQNKYYLKIEKEIREYDSNPNIQKNLDYVVVLKYPLEVDNQWVTFKDNKETIYKIVATNLKLKILNKEFDCIKILEHYKKEQGIRYLYYAANIGCIKITTASLKNPQQEFTVLELVN